jgi:16S rRNA (cytosine1402-N4)-methyltransferase
MNANLAGNDPSSHHEPVLYQQIIHALQPVSEGLYVDCTAGAGGHAYGILEASSPDGRLLAMDVDPQAIQIAEAKLAPFKDRMILVLASYTSLRQQLDTLGWLSVNGILFDLGLSSIQVDRPERGFSFLQDGPLDMRFDPTATIRAEDLVNDLTIEELSAILFRFGEERYSRQIAREIVRKRPLYTTRDLTEAVISATGRGRSRIHPATRTFQAIRIAVNQELQALESALPLAIQSLVVGGRLAVISFHSLEDRIVKLTFQRESRDCICPPDQPICTCGHSACLKLLNKKPVTPETAEVSKNPRSRSAKLRVAEKI